MACSWLQALDLATLLWIALAWVLARPLNTSGLALILPHIRMWLMLIHHCHILQHSHGHTDSLPVSFHASDFQACHICSTTLSVSDHLGCQHYTQITPTACKYLDKYYSKTDLSHVYCLGMGVWSLIFYASIPFLTSYTVLHPQMKLKYFTQHGWAREWVETVEEIIQDEFANTMSWWPMYMCKFTYVVPYHNAQCQIIANVSDWGWCCWPAWYPYEGHWRGEQTWWVPGETAQESYIRMTSLRGDGLFNFQKQNHEIQTLP